VAPVQQDRRRLYCRNFGHQTLYCTNARPARSIPRNSPTSVRVKIVDGHCQYPTQAFSEPRSGPNAIAPYPAYHYSHPRHSIQASSHRSVGYRSYQIIHQRSSFNKSLQSSPNYPNPIELRMFDGSVSSSWSDSNTSTLEYNHTSNILLLSHVSISPRFIALISSYNQIG